MHGKTLAFDARYFQIIFQVTFLMYGLLFLHWPADWGHYTITTFGCLLFSYIAESLKKKRFLPLIGKDGFRVWGLSTLISAASLCLLLKTNYWQISLFAAFATVSSKYFFRIGQKHLFNPSAFGIVAAIFLTDAAWLSAAQWGSNAVIFFATITLGTIVVTRVQKLDISLAFLLTFIALLYWRQVYVLGWPMDHFIHSVSTGSLLLFSFFMISDPRTSPDHPVARIMWAMLIAFVSFYLAAFKWMYNTPIWMLVVAAPLVPILDMIMPAGKFSWKTTSFQLVSFSKLKKIIMNPFMKKMTATILLCTMMIYETSAFCGFYVSKADGTLKNKTSQVILVRDGDKNVITMYNDFQGDFRDFAMVVPVPVILQKKDIKVVDQQIFHTLNDYSKPRLVEYYDENPCSPAFRYELEGRVPGLAMDSKSAGRNESRSKPDLGVKIEAKYLVGEYDILILSAKESSGLKTWLTENGYKIPAGAEEVLEPYIKSNLKFFVVKVNQEEKKKLPGNFLRPLQISFSSPKFMLPIRLGMANSDGDQDMIVYAFTKKGRVECTNYRTVAVPTSKNIPLFVQNDFGKFYANLFQYQWKSEGKAIAMLEYAWDVSPKNFVKCDPCVATAPSQQDLVQAGVWWLGRNWQDYSDVDSEESYSTNVHFTRLHVRYNRKSFPQDLQFQVTPNTESFQARYIIRHPATGDLDCEAGKKYLQQLKERRKGELAMLTYLTGKGYSDWDVVSNDEVPVEGSYITASRDVNNGNGKENAIVFATLGLCALASFIRIGRKS